ncbi:MAG TPA: hypothetical protein VN893_07950 [Bryobacteraceae bacterium]|nr:hypothetical protein [Bryobacteraceae bacterium]
MLAVLYVAGAVFGQQALDCYSSRKVNKPGRKALWDGYEVSVGLTPKSSEDPGEACTIAIYDRAGHVVFRTTGFGAAFDEDGTGMDFDGDGRPEVVLKADTGGGNRFCWSEHVISLWPKPHELVEIPELGRVHFEEDRQGRTVIWATRPPPSGAGELGFGHGPFAQRVLRFSEGRLRDVTPEFCSEILSYANQR